MEGVIKTSLWLSNLFLVTRGEDHPTYFITGSSGRPYERRVFISIHRMGGGVGAGCEPRLRRIFSKNADLPVTFFSMGSPLRQIYSIRFPHLYEWVRQPNDDAVQQEKPDPAELGVRKWINAYRTGDYVGRVLWRSENNEESWRVAVHDFSSERRELCIGAGAHTHYWDATARSIAEELNRIVRGGGGSAAGERLIRPGVLATKGS
jgi:hypothetical protein